jgi:DNA-binding transcriptional ArsR family regulator
MRCSLTEDVDTIKLLLDELLAKHHSPTVRNVSLAEESSPGEDPQAPLADRRATKPSLPQPRLVRRILQARQMRSRYFDHDLFADPAWDMLLDLTASEAEYGRVSVTSLCIASGVPPTTALRWISALGDAGLVQRHQDPVDARRTFVSLTSMGVSAISSYFAALGSLANSLL